VDAEERTPEGELDHRKGEIDVKDSVRRVDGGEARRPPRRVIFASPSY
jgi:hypothetical protein